MKVGDPTAPVIFKYDVIWEPFTMPSRGWAACQCGELYKLLVRMGDTILAPADRCSTDGTEHVWPTLRRRVPDLLPSAASSRSSAFDHGRGASLE